MVRSDCFTTSPLFVLLFVTVRTRTIKEYGCCLACLCLSRSIKAIVPRHDVSQASTEQRGPLRLSCHCYCLFSTTLWGDTQSNCLIRSTYTNNERPLIRLARVDLGMGQVCQPRRRRGSQVPGPRSQVPASWRAAVASRLGQWSAAMRWHRKTHGRGTAPSCWIWIRIVGASSNRNHNRS